ncbi:MULTISPECIES: hypothetical protein [unclassified Tolypothrix]|uniref:hypothetical protein n=1 Tax=unclassified Tolypothrix TaxID=2649714 RepID=UPI0005EAB352|nr:MULTISPECIES: hypothetical protein [unclassified Tolypothrix]BAY93052.1 hypothetical protein NIES3275_50890 [Microchaete diplosiphon NIES-3275]EKF02687.1 hypothetical protein FDUTEX481_05988 [Tolypothrix sp. PCC 7601]MBE9085570.1 hypothetical protein [Tolypothrix sp. LEGE 11397]UYD26936.1 hypothetical protein HGR01_02155 [Tolypothrix sp. PCC 7712]UYD37205.1 hypothetical protein HG267_16640 [Tolypothrix sp. PCC 7601]
MQTVVKLTQQSVQGEIESVLDTYPYNPYQQAFAIPDLRQELIKFVLNRIPCLYYSNFEGHIPFSEDDKEYLIKSKLPRSPLEQQLYVQNLIHQGIYTIFKDKSDWISHHLCEKIQPGFEPSHWFG